MLHPNIIKEHVNGSFILIAEVNIHIARFLNYKILIKGQGLIGTTLPACPRLAPDSPAETGTRLNVISLHF